MLMFRFNLKRPGRRKSIFARKHPALTVMIANIRTLFSGSRDQDKKAFELPTKAFGLKLSIAMLKTVRQ